MNIPLSTPLLLAGSRPSWDPRLPKIHNRLAHSLGRLPCLRGGIGSLPEQVPRVQEQVGSYPTQATSKHLEVLEVYLGSTTNSNYDY